MRSNQLLHWKFLDCYSNILNFSLFYTKKRFNKKWWRNYNVSAALNEDMESGSWFHVRRSYFAKYGENEVIIMDDMPNVLTCTNVHLSLGSEIPLRMNLWINMLSWFFLLPPPSLLLQPLSFANKCTYSIHIDYIPDARCDQHPSIQCARARVCSSVHIMLRTSKSSFDV